MLEFDAHAPSAPPTQIARVDVGTPFTLGTVGDHLVVVGSYGVVTLQPLQSGGYREVGWIRTSISAAALDEDELWVAERSGISRIALGDPANPGLHGTGLIAGPTIIGLAMARRSLVVSAGALGLFVLDVRDPERPVERGYLDFENSILQVAADDGTVAVTSVGRDSLFLVDARDPFWPTVFARANSPATLPTDPIVGHDWVAAIHGGSMHIYDRPAVDPPPVPTVEPRRTGTATATATATVTRTAIATTAATATASVTATPRVDRGTIGARRIAFPHLMRAAP